MDDEIIKKDFASGFSDFIPGSAKREGFNANPVRNSGFSTIYSSRNALGPRDEPYDHIPSGEHEWEGNEEYWAALRGLYGNVLDASGMNLKDPIDANLFYYNKFQRRGNVDPPYVGKTYVFVTRPDLNIYGGKTATDGSSFSTSGFSNLKTMELFDFISKTAIGKHILPFLTYPHGMKMPGTGKRVERSPIGDYSGDDEIIIEKFNPDGNKLGKYHTPFIPFFTNLCVSSGAGKDLVLEDYETEGDFSGNRLTYPKGADETFSIGETSLSFKDMYGSPCLHFANLWVQYIYYLSKGIISICYDYKKFHIIDFTCSIYVFVLDKDFETILRWAKYTGCYPNVIPFGTIQHNLEGAADVMADLNLNFKYNRYEPMKPTTFADFNKINEQFARIALAKRLEGNPVAPEALIKDTKIEEIITPEMFPPKTRESGGETLILRNKKKSDYDGLFWGACPYISNGRLIFL